MGSPSAIISLGLGSWGSVNEVVTLGYGSSNVVVVSGPFHLEALGVFQGGAVVMHTHSGGAARSGVFQGGAVVAEAVANG